MIQPFRKQLLGSRAEFIAVVWLLASALPGEAGAMLKHLERVSPRIGQRGTTVEISIQGAHLDDPREIIFDRPGIRAQAARTTGVDARRSDRSGGEMPV
jgi:hypothetical protein